MVSRCIGMGGLAVVAIAGCGRLRFDERTDAGGPIDGSGSDGAGSDATTACAFTFCDDFDRAGPLEAGWDAVANTGGASLALATDENVSTPQSFKLALPAPQHESGFLEKKLPKITSSARVKLALSYGSADPGIAEVDLVQLQWDVLPVGCTSFGYYLVRDGTGPFDLQETYGGCGGNENTPFTALDNTGFHDVEMFVFAGAIGTARVKVVIDGEIAVDKLTSHAIPESTLLLRIGGGAVRDVSTPWTVRYDDVIVDIR